MAKIKEQVRELLEPEIKKLGYILYDVEYAKEGPDYHLVIFIDKEDGIGIQDCEKVNNVIEPILDEKDIIPNSYVLEVSSSGEQKEKNKLKGV